MENEIKESIDGLMGSIGEFKASYDGKLTQLGEALAKIESKIGRPGAAGSLPGVPGVSIEAKNLDFYIRGDFKAMTVAVDPQAGYFVPDILQNTMTEKLYDPPTFLSLVRTEMWSGPGSEWIEPLKRALLTARRRGSETQAAQDTGATNPVGLLTVEAGEAEAEVTFSQKLVDDTARDLSSMTIADTRAATLAGATVQASVVARMLGEQGSGWAKDQDVRATRNIASTLSRIARAA